MFKFLSFNYDICTCCKSKEDGLDEAGLEGAGSDGTGRDRGTWDGAGWDGEGWDGEGSDLGSTFPSSSKKDGLTPSRILSDISPSWRVGSVVAGSFREKSSITNGFNRIPF